MLNLGKFPTQITYSALIHNPVSQNLQFPSKPHFSFPTNYHNFHAVLGKKPSGLCCNAMKTQKKGGFSLNETDGFDEFEEDFDDEFLDIEDDGEIEEDEEEVPLQNMKKWLENKPSGFGEGKVYDTSVEDKLMEEIEQSRKAQLANINKLKNSPNRTSSKKEVDKGPSQDEFRVRLINLPKKKNIHRDLRVAFTGVPGIVKIVPFVSGNEKTRDPVCKGLAFVHFKRKDEAQRFIQNFSGTSLSFGKVQKQIKCEMMNPILPIITLDHSVDESNRTSEKNLLNSVEDKSVDAGFETDDSELDSSEQSLTSELDEEDDERHESGQEGDGGEINGASTTAGSNLADKLKIGEESAINSSSSKRIRKPKTKEKKAASKQKKEKSPKLNIPIKLKIREKEMLAGVFSKYGANSTSTVKEHSR